MLQQHQDSLLPRVTQGEEGHETTGKRPYLVRINRVLHVVNIHVLTRNRLCEIRLKDGYREVTASMAYESTVSSNPEAGENPPFGDVVLALSAFAKGVFCTDTPFPCIFRILTGEYGIISQYDSNY